MARRDAGGRPTNHESYQQLSLVELRPLGRLVAPDPPTRKGDLVPFLADAMARGDVVRWLHDALDDAGRAAIQEATHDPAGRVDRERFRAKYGRLPDSGTAKAPTPLRLFLPGDGSSRPSCMRSSARSSPRPEPWPSPRARTCRGPSR